MRNQMSGSTAQCWRDFEAVLDAGLDRVLLYGPSGTGKTFTALTYDVPEGGAFRLTCTDDMTSADVAGCFMPAKDGFAWLDGAALRAWRGNGQRGGRLVVDEIDRASGDVLSQLLAFTDSEACTR
jgi:MoxR-like ATPase